MSKHKPIAPAKKPPKARVLYGYSHREDPQAAIETGFRLYPNEFYTDPYASIPCRTLKQARALAKAANMSGVQREVLLRTVVFRVPYFPQNDYQHRIVAAILNALGYHE